MTDINELAQSLKAAADREMIYRDGAETSEIWERTVTPENILALVVALESEKRICATWRKTAESIIGNYPGTPDCWCCTCRPVVLNDMRFVVCPDCGNKRCPRANDHRNSCTGSNEPGQEGSAYPDIPREVI